MQLQSIFYLGDFREFHSRTPFFMIRYLYAYIEEKHTNKQPVSLKDILDSNAGLSLRIS